MSLSDAPRGGGTEKWREMGWGVFVSNWYFRTVVVSNWYFITHTAMELEELAEHNALASG